MRNWRARLLVGFMLVAIMLATVAGPVLANDGERGDGFNGRGERIDDRRDGNDNHRDCDFWDCDFNREFDEVEVVFVPVGFWNFHYLWGWFWDDCEVESYGTVDCD